MISNDIILQHILPRLQTKSLLRFRCVCKRWNSFIQHPFFLRLRQSINCAHHHLLFACPDLCTYGFKNTNPNVYTAPLSQHQPHTIAPATPSFMVNHAYNSIAVQCVNGFLCVHPKDDYYMSHSPIQVFNPTTRQIITIPDDVSLQARGLSTVGTHFGYDPSRDEFMILRLIEDVDAQAYQFRILIVGEANSWMDITPVNPFDPKMYFSVCRQRGVCVNGAIYWAYKSEKLVSFDLRHKQFRVTALPPGYVSNGLTKYKELVELDGCLALVRHTIYGHTHNLDLWILKDYESEVWIEESIRFPCVKDSPSQRSRFPYMNDLPPQIMWEEHLICPLGKMHTGEILLVPYLLDKEVKTYYYDMERRSSRSIVIAKVPHSRWPKEDIKLVVDMFFCQENFRIL